MVEVLLIFAGICIGVSITTLIVRAYHVGTLRVDRSDPYEPPMLFLELSESVGKISRKKNVILKVKVENYISQK